MRRRVPLTLLMWAMSYLCLSVYNRATAFTGARTPLHPVLANYLSKHSCKNRTNFFKQRGAWMAQDDGAMLPACAAALGQQHAAGSTTESPPKRRRVDWQWECPACSNKHPSGPRLLLHMHKCCPDLLPVTCDLAHIKSLISEEQHSPCHSSQQQPPPAHMDCDRQHGEAHVSQPQDSSSRGAEPLQRLLHAAQQQEHKLRMRALHLRFIDDSKQQAQAAATAGDAADEQCASKTQSSSPQAAPVQQQHALAQTVQQHGAPKAATATAADDTESTAAAGVVCGEVLAARGDDSLDAAAAPTRRRSSRRGSSGRTPVRTIEQLMQEMQLPHARVVKLLERAPRSIRLVADSEHLQVVFEDNHFLAVCKPPGLRSAPVHRFLGGSAVNRMIGHLGTEPYLLHRLDMDTSGVLLAAKDAATAGAVNRQFEEKRVSKAYLALCLGVPEQQEFTVDGPIGQHPGVRVARQVVPGGQPATTHVQVLSVSSVCPHHLGMANLNSSSSSNDNPVSLCWGPAAAPEPTARVKGAGCCLVCCRPVTGRTHQIRVHMAHSGHSLIGDDVYGLQGPWIQRQALHAVCLSLEHPGTGQPVTFVAAPPEDFVAAAASLGLAIPPLRELAESSRRIPASGPAAAGL